MLEYIKDTLNIVIEFIVDCINFTINKPLYDFCSLS